MKNKFFKMILPAVVVTFGILSAVSTSAMNKKTVTLAQKWGYSHIEGENCVRQIMCKTDPGLPCKTVAGDQLYDFVSTVSCPNPLNKI